MSSFQNSNMVDSANRSGINVGCQVVIDNIFENNIIRLANEGILLMLYGLGTFDDEINLSNTTTTDSQDAEIGADGSNVVVTWWERNQTSDEPAAKISTDNGQTFGPILKLGTNGTIGEAEEEG